MKITLILDIPKLHTVTQAQAYIQTLTDRILAITEEEGDIRSITSVIQQGPAAKGRSRGHHPHNLHGG